jgi:hypothetical protein
VTDPTWWAGPVICAVCVREWVAVVELPEDVPHPSELECPGCHAMAGYAVVPEDQEADDDAA